MKFLLLSTILYALGTILYFQIRREQQKPLFNHMEWFVFGVALSGCIVGVYGLATGSITI